MTMNTLNPSLPRGPHTVPGPATAAPATGTRYLLALPSDAASLALARGWLWLGLLALLGAGLFSVLLVLARTPGLNHWFPSASFFRVALVVHVDLSVLVWFVAMAGLLWSLSGSSRGVGWGRVALGLCGAGTVLMALAPWTGAADPVMANYIPVLDGPAFLAGLVVFACGVALLVLRSLWAARPLGTHFGGDGVLRFGLNASAVATGVALLAFAWSWAVLSPAMAGAAYYEILFWGGGHALQFTWTLLMLVAWLWLAGACGVTLRLTPRVSLLLLLLALLSVFVTPYAYLAQGIATVEHRQVLTWAMRLGGGVSIVPVGLAVMLGLAEQRAVAHEQRPARSALLASMLLFGAGGLIGVMIQGSNVRIPAHYHGCIVGVTLALMGLVFHLLPRLGYRAPATRWATWQPVVYGAGQLMHIVGLVWSGGYGVQRKVAGSEQVLHGAGEVAGMALMGAGGLIAIIGGLMFALLVLRAVRGGVDRKARR